MDGELPFTHYAEVNPKRHLRRGEEYPFVEMAALPEGGGELRYLGRRVFDGQGSRFAVGDTLFARITPCTENGKTSIVRRLDGCHVGFGSTEFIVLAARDGSCPEFVYQVAVSPEVRRRAVSRMLGTSGRQRVPTWFFEEELRLPAFAAPEQHRIGALLRAIDEAIEKTEGVIAATEELRKALLQELLTRGVPGWHTEWKQVPGIGTIPACWEVVRLGEVATRVTDGVHQAVQFNDDGEIPFLFVSCIPGGTIEWGRAGRITRETYLDITRSFRPARGDVLYTAVGSYGNAALVDFDQEFAFQRHIAVIRPGPGVAAAFLKIALTSPLGRTQAGKVAVGNAQKTVTLEALKKFILPLPPGHEQGRIAELVAAIDLRGAAEQCHLQECQRAKNLWADALLSGRVRVPVGEDLSG